MITNTMRFDDLVRSERYFTATLLPLILFHDDFRGLMAFVELLDGKANTEYDDSGNRLPRQAGAYSIPPTMDDATEIVTEFHIARDLHFAGKLPKVEQQGTEDAPDLVLVLGERAIMCEGKFFAKYTLEKLNHQLRSQRAQARFLFEARPQLRSYLHVALLPADPGVSVECNAVITWPEVAELSRQILGADHYVTKRLDHSVRWWEQLHGDDVDAGTRNYDGRLWLDDVLDLCRKHGDEVHVGHKGGEAGLKRQDPEYLRNKFWKWRYPGSNRGVVERKNWIPGTRFLATIHTVEPDEGAMPMGDPTRFDAVVEAVEALPHEEQEMLVDLIRRRWTEQRRAEIGANISQSLEEYHRGEVGRGTVEDLFRQTEE